MLSKKTACLGELSKKTACLVELSKKTACLGELSKHASARLVEPSTAADDVCPN
jgi:hypothetical protein